MQWLESCKSSFVEYKIGPSLNKHTKLKFSKVNAENSTATIINNTEVIFSDHHQATESKRQISKVLSKHLTGN